MVLPIKKRWFDLGIRKNDSEVLNMDDKQSFKKVMKPISEIIEEVCEDICDNYCKYRGTEDEDNICDMIRETGSCPLDRLY